MKINKLTILCAAFVLAGCAPTIVKQPVPVEIPVSVPCRAPAVTPPPWHTTGVTAQNSLFQQVKALLATEEQRKAYEARLTAALSSCQ